MGLRTTHSCQTVKKNRFQEWNVPQEHSGLNLEKLYEGPDEHNDY
jgi:hypothetical protein